MFPIEAGVDPDIDDGVECATTYILEPGATTLEVYHSLFNAGPDEIDGPMGAIADSGGNTEAWTNTRGFERADISALATLASRSRRLRALSGSGRRVRRHPAPRHADPHTQALIAGVSILLDGNDASCSTSSSGTNTSCT